MELYFIDGAINSEQLDNLRGCILGTSYKMMYSDTIDNHAIVGPLLKSINTNNDNDCKDACFMHVPDVCYMFNYYPQTKKCELFYKDRVSEYKVEKRNGCYFKTRQCDVNPCLDGKRCYSLGEQSHTSCI
ncbi:uncharacterized protein LOC114575700 [Exaiptasia diaphana]|uniref:Apple domain-containing protein n=1 Tax=Exaiptasia diaphana TaxID=2652724 RepID=A0A913YQX6_EXADI|nr:uncharacterized protein LOC114575700 [Exaiptasia diaphana]